MARPQRRVRAMRGDEQQQVILSAIGRLTIVFLRITPCE